MKLLREFIDIDDIEVIKEDVDVDGKKKKEYFLKGPFLEAENKNQNGRVYPLKLLEREVKNYNINFIERKRALGELDHSTDPNVLLKLASHKIIELKMDGKIGYGVAKLMDTPNGRIGKVLVDEEILLGMSTKGIGTVTGSDDGDIVNEDFFLGGVDIVSTPSARIAVVEGIIENKEYIIGNDGKIVEIAMDNLQKKVDKKFNKYAHKDMSAHALQCLKEFLTEINSKKVINS
jgi:hypothetical protein